MHSVHSSTLKVIVTMKVVFKVFEMLVLTAADSIVVSCWLTDK